MMKTKKDNFALITDTLGFACAIKYKNIWVLHLERGTVRNEQYAEWIVDRLNGKKKAAPKLLQK